MSIDITGLFELLWGRDSRSGEEHKTPVVGKALDMESYLSHI